MPDDRSTQRVIALGLGAVVVAGGAIALWLGLRDGASAQPAATPAETSPPPRPSPAPALPEPGHGGAPIVSETEPAAGSAVDRGREQVIDGVRVRDHRKNGGQVGLPSTMRPPDRRKLSTESTGAISNQVLAIVKQCAEVVPKDARGDNPRIEGSVTASVKGGQITVSQAGVEIRRVTGDAAASLKSCIEQRALGLVAQALGGETEVDEYPINLNYALP